MKRFSEQLKKKSLTLKLTAAEKRDVRERLVAYMEYHPLPATTKAVPASAPAVEYSPYRIIAVPARYIRLAAGVCAVFVFVVLPAMAENAIPGDILYPVKVRVTEEIRGSLNLSSYEKVAWETERLERRVAEARELAKEGRLMPEVEADVLAAVQQHTNAAEHEIASLMETDVEGASLAQMTFATALDVQSAVLKSEHNDDETADEAGSPIQALAGALEQGREVAFGKGAQAPVSFERLMAQLELQTTRAHELLSSIAKTATVQERKDIERRLADIERAINEAAGKHGEEPEEAVVMLRTSWRDTQKLISFMTDIDVRASVSVETLVPVVPTIDERRLEVEKRLTPLRADVQRIVQGMETIEDEDITEKIEAALPQITALLEVAATTEPETIKLAEEALVSAEELVKSILSLATFPLVTDEETAETGDDDTEKEGDGATGDEEVEPVATSTRATSSSSTVKLLPRLDV